MNRPETSLGSGAVDLSRLGGSKNIRANETIKKKRRKRKEEGKKNMTKQKEEERKNEREKTKER